MLRKLFCSKFCFLFLIILFSIGFLGYRGLKYFPPEKIFNSTFVQDRVIKPVGGENSGLINLAPRLLGFTKPITYLVLLENNTELRPAGGFIGTYAVIEVNKGKINIIKVEGTEIIDRNTPEDWRPTPPMILKKHLGVDRWYFRDANWSPDFGESAKKALELYKGEGGVKADNINAIIAITPTVVEELMMIVGPVEVQDVEFTAENVTEKLEYEVEYGYEDKDIHVLERKQIIEPFMKELIKRLTSGALFNINNYLDLFSRLAMERQIFLYSLDEELQKFIVNEKLSGQIVQTDGDYLLWVDANLAALKTDVAIERKLNYSFYQDENGKILATAEMTYDHKGSFDWRTSRYRTYARLFVPFGSELISVDGAMKWDRTSAPGEVHQGTELNKTWFGSFIAIEPGKTDKLSFTYYLPDQIGQQIKDGMYTLFVQKQLGTIDTSLTLGLDFGTNITVAKPAEEEGDYGDDRYNLITNLRVDREFTVSFRGTE